jgi:hypothetical protein
MIAVCPTPATVCMVFQLNRCGALAGREQPSARSEKGFDAAGSANGRYDSRRLCALASPRARFPGIGPRCAYPPRSGDTRASLACNHTALLSHQHRFEQPLPDSCRATGCNDGWGARVISQTVLNAANTWALQHSLRPEFLPAAPSL